MPWKSGREQYVRTGKYLEGLLTSIERGFDVTTAIILRTAHALGFPVVPEVYISAVRSLGDLFAAVNVDGEYCCNCEVVTSSDTAETPSKDDILNDR